jgi:hypothetical protein
MVVSEKSGEAAAAPLILTSPQSYLLPIADDTLPGLRPAIPKIPQAHSCKRRHTTSSPLILEPAYESPRDELSHMSRIANQPCWISTGPSEHGMMTWRRDQIGCRNVINAESLQTPLTTVVLRSIDLQVGNHLGRGSLRLGSLDSRTLLEYAWQRH